jgi:hypothetical protein
MIITQKISRQTDVKSATQSKVAQKQSRKTISIKQTVQKQSRKTVSTKQVAQKQSRKIVSIKKVARKTSVDRNKTFKKYKIKRKDEKTNFDDEFIFLTRIFIILMKITVKALREIRRLQRSTNLLISRLSFQRVVRDVLYDIDATYRIRRSALKTLQKAAKTMFITKFENKIS